MAAQFLGFRPSFPSKDWILHTGSDFGFAMDLILHDDFGVLMYASAQVGAYCRNNVYGCALLFCRPFLPLMMAPQRHLRRVCIKVQSHAIDPFIRSLKCKLRPRKIQMRGDPTGPLPKTALNSFSLAI